jgi:non-heme chloroperoxidase
VIDNFIQLDDELTIHYQQAGQGDNTILLLPGWTMSTRVFERQLEYFAESDQFRFISFDPRAHGLSSKTAAGHYYEQHGRDLHAFINALELDNIILGGWSFGCLATLAYINQFGAERLNGLLMLDGPPRAAAADNKCDWATYRYDDADGGQQFYTLGRLKDPEATNREFAAWMLEDKSAANIRWVLEITQQTPDYAAALLNATSIFLDYRDDLRALEGRIPLCYLMRADQGKMVAHWARENTPSAQVAAFGEHLMFWERAAEFNQLLTEFTRRCIA